MAKCVNISAPHRKLCAGNLRKRIGLYDRAIASPTFGSEANKAEYTLIANVKSEIATNTRGIHVFNGMQPAEDGVVTTATHQFTIRFREDASDVHYIRLAWKNGQTGQYEVLGYSNIDERDEWVVFYCAFQLWVGTGDTA